MPRPRVYVKATFVSTQQGSKPPVCIDSPVDLSEHISDINKSNGYHRLKSKLVEIMDDTVYEMFWHRDSFHRYTFDELVLQNGAIYGLKERRSSNGNDAGKKLTARYLVPLETSSDFQKHLEDVAEVFCQRCGRGNRLKQVGGYKVELYVVLIREKVKQVAPTRSIVCGVDTTIATSISASGSGITGQKRKDAPLPFTFQANQIYIALFDPIETQKRKTDFTTGVPSGKTKNEIMYDLWLFILGSGRDNESATSGHHLIMRVVINTLRLPLLYLDFVKN